MKKKHQAQTIGNSSDQVVEKVENCQQCSKPGSLREKVSKVQNFKDVIFSDFNCQQCGHVVEQLKFADTRNDFGIEILFVLQHAADSQRQVVHSQTAEIKIEQLSLIIESTKNPQITTINGIVQRGLQQLRLRKQLVQNSQQQLDKVISQINRTQQVLEGKHFPLTIRIRDPSGNSNVRNLNYPLPDKSIQVCYFERTLQELQKIGFTHQQAELQINTIEEKKKGIKLNFNKPFEEKDFLNKTHIAFELPCHTCMMPGEMKLCETSVPYFTDLVIMSFSCQYCGAHSVETKNSGEVPEEALEITLKVDTENDLKRDLFKSDTCKVCIPELDLELDYGTLGGQYTTVEGLLEKVHDHLSGRNSFIEIDSEFSIKMKSFLSDLLMMKDGEKSFTLQLIDPLSRSFLQNPYHPLQDKKARIVSRKRNQEEEDVLGFTGMNVDNYL